MTHHFRGYQSCAISEAVSFCLGLSGMSLKDKQLSAIKAVYEGRNVFVCSPTGYGKRPLVPNSTVLLWNTNLLEIELSSLCLPWLLY